MPLRVDDSMKSAIIAICLSLLFAPSAHARDWWMIDVGSNRCHPSQFTPDAFEQALRRSDKVEGIPKIEVERDDDSNVIGVEITVTLHNGQQITNLFAVSYPICEQVRKRLVDEGYITPRNDLR